VSQTVNGAAGSGFLRHAALGFHGKIPARGDFVQAGLPRTFTDPWDDWMQRMVGASRSVLGQAWRPAWLEAPVWRFALSPGICGPDAAIGLWVPSVDSVGRYFPFTVAAVASAADSRGLMREAGGFLTAAELVARDALENDLPPDELAARLAAAASASTTRVAVDPSLCPPQVGCPPRGGLWWIDGAPRVSDRGFASAGLPDENTFITMLVSCYSMRLAISPEQTR
jgi:type VI secretion system protein ImpM